MASQAFHAYAPFYSIVALTRFHVVLTNAREWPVNNVGYNVGSVPLLRCALGTLEELLGRKTLLAHKGLIHASEIDLAVLGVLTQMFHAFRPMNPAA